MTLHVITEQSKGKPNPRIWYRTTRLKQKNGNGKIGVRKCYKIPRNKKPRYWNRKHALFLLFLFFALVFSPLECYIKSMNHQHYWRQRENKIKEGHSPEKRNLKDDEDEINERSNGRNGACPFLWRSHSLKFFNAPFGRDLAQMGRERSHGSWCTWYRPHFDTCA